MYSKGRFIPDWFTNLHMEAINRFTSGPMRPGMISDRPEVVRDLLETGFLEVSRIPKGRGSICLYRVAR